MSSPTPKPTSSEDIVSQKVCGLLHFFVWNSDRIQYDRCGRFFCSCPGGVTRLILVP